MALKIDLQVSDLAEQVECNCAPWIEAEVDWIAFAERKVIGIKCLRHQQVRKSSNWKHRVEVEVVQYCGWLVHAFSEKCRLLK